jgi:hypothetical protein
MAAKKKLKISPNAILTTAVLIGTGVVLYKLYNLANEYEKIAKNVQTKGLLNTL